MAIAYFSTWTTYGTWLPGDERGWWAAATGLQPPDQWRSLAAELSMTEDALLLVAEQRRLVEEVIAKHCIIRGWTLHAVSCRSNHVHVVVTAQREPIERPREQFKAWCTKELKAHSPDRRTKWWTSRGWDKYIDDEQFLENAVWYVLCGQDLKGCADIPSLARPANEY